jgi:hypothetical protein
MAHQYIKLMSDNKMAWVCGSAHLKYKEKRRLLMAFRMRVRVGEDEFGMLTAASYIGKMF